MSDEHYSTIKKRYTCWQNPIPNWMLTDWNMLEINTNNNVIPVVSDENRTLWRFTIVNYTLLVPHSIVAHGGIILHTQHLGHPAHMDYSTYICTTCQHFGTRIPLSMLLWSCSCASVHALELFFIISPFFVHMVNLKDGIDSQSSPSDMAVVSTQLNCDGAITWNCLYHMFQIAWTNFSLQHRAGQLVGRVPERYPPCDPGDLRFVHIEIMNGLQVPWDPGVHSILMARSACGQADSQGGKNVMTLATEKPAGQAMTWAGVKVNNGLGLMGAAGL